MAAKLNHKLAKRSTFCGMASSSQRVLPITWPRVRPYYGRNAIKEVIREAVKLVFGSMALTNSGGIQLSDGFLLINDYAQRYGNSTSNAGCKNEKII